MGLVHHPNVVTDGLVGCWDAGNRKSYPGAGTTWTDIAGVNNSTLQNGGDGGLSFDSANGGSIVFDGTNDYTTATNFDDVSPVSGTNSFAFDMWIYLDDTNAITFITQRVDSNNRWSWWWNASSDMYFNVWTSGSDVSSGAYNHSFTADNWYHLALVRDGNTILFYIDSVLKYSASYTHSITAKAAGLDFGYDQQNYGGSSNNAKYALVRAYNKALSAAEVLQNYNATKGRFT